MDQEVTWWFREADPAWLPIIHGLGPEPSGLKSILNKCAYMPKIPRGEKGLQCGHSPWKMISHFPCVFLWQAQVPYDKNLKKMCAYIYIVCII